MLLTFGQIMHNPFPDQVFRQSLPSATLVRLRFLGLILLWFYARLGVFLRFPIAGLPECFE